MPVFELVSNGAVVLYVPGSVAASTKRQAQAVEAAYHGDARQPAEVLALAAELEARAAHATSAWRALANLRYEPECLTIYLSNRCHLACTYCYSAGPHGERNVGWNQPLPVLSLEALRAAAHLVALNCGALSKPLQLVIHGGGEPTLHWQLLQDALTTVRQVAAERAVAVRSYLSTSGVVSEAQAGWLAEHVDHVSLSVDGPPDVQDAQRPLRSGHATSAAVERTASILRIANTRYSVRCTVTRATVRRQAELVVYFATRLGARALSFEPVYRERGDDVWAFSTEEDAALFADQFLCAQLVADQLGCTLETSGVRLDEIHGPHCNTLKQVLLLTPDAAAMPCFVCTDGTQARFARLRLGHFDRNSKSFLLDHERADQMTQRAATIPARCQGCHNIYHCARSCPDSCPLDEGPVAGGFRCAVQERLAREWIVGSTAPGLPESLPLDSEELAAAVACLAQAPATIEVAPIAWSWLRARPRDIARRRRAPDPAWAVRGFDATGPEAWAALAEEACARRSSGPLSVYVHVPYCDRKCSFCDCHMQRLPRDEQGAVTSYLEVMGAELEAWAALGAVSGRPVTTVHFGGGTPTLLSSGALTQLVTAIRSTFATSSRTEWALESTTSQLTEESQSVLERLGLTRLHVGVQSLDDEVRRRAGRKESAEAVLQKLRRALARGQTVTADVMYGLPGQSLQSVLETIVTLDSLGIHGFSLYGLNVSAHNRSFVRQHARDLASGTELFLTHHIAHQLLETLGYEKTHHAHYSKAQDRYLYYRHVLRGEDLVSLGPSADGSMGELHYRNEEMPRYLRSRVLAGSVRASDAERRLHAATVGLMTAEVGVAALQSLATPGLINGWLGQGLIALDPVVEAYRLTASGSWFLGDMLHELSQGLQASASSSKE